MIRRMEPFKNRVGPDAIQQISAAVSRAWPAEGVAFAADDFRRAALAGLDALELKARVVHVADTLAAHLPPFERAIPILLATLGEPADPEAPDAANDGGGLRGFAAWPLLRYVARHGIDDPSRALPALGEMTGRMSAEFAVRPFLLTHPEIAWQAVDGWSTHADVHRRRLASEGTRPRLPWGVRLTPSVADPTRGLQVIERLVDDPQLYVRRSVANHLNDVSKDHPDRALTVAERWSAGVSPDRAWVVRHALRTRLKAADPRALTIIGRPPADVAVEGLTADGAVARGDKLPFAFDLYNRQQTPAPLRVDYLLHRVLKSGKRSAKAYSVGDMTLAPGERRAVARSHDFRRVSTRTLYPGTHRIEIRVNGVAGDGFDFELT